MHVKLKAMTHNSVGSLAHDLCGGDGVVGRAFRGPLLLFVQGVEVEIKGWWRASLPEFKVLILSRSSSDRCTT